MSYLIAHAPHVRDKASPPQMMLAVILALIPAVIASVYFFGPRAFFLIMTCVVTAVATEFAMQKIMRREVSINDWSAVITGLLLALTVSPGLPYFAAILGTVFAVAIGKQLFGGLGYNIFNPALIGRAFLAATFPVQMTNWAAPFAYRGLEAVAAATPLADMKFQHQLTPYLTLLIGNVSGSIGETSALLLLAGGLYLAWRKIIDWRIPVGYLGTVAVLSGILWLIDPTKFADPVFHLLAGGLMLGAWFMATDLVTSPLTRKGAWIFGVGAGILVVVIRQWGGLPEGVVYSILLMNAVTPLINRYTRPRIYGK